MARRKKGGFRRLIQELDRILDDFSMTAPDDGSIDYALDEFDLLIEDFQRALIRLDTDLAKVSNNPGIKEFVKRHFD